MEIPIHKTLIDFQFHYYEDYEPHKVLLSFLGYLQKCKSRYLDEVAKAEVHLETLDKMHKLGCYNYKGFLEEYSFSDDDPVNGVDGYYEYLMYKHIQLIHSGYEDMKKEINDFIGQWQRYRVDVKNIIAQLNNIILFIDSEIQHEKLIIKQGGQSKPKGENVPYKLMLLKHICLKEMFDKGYTKKQVYNQIAFLINCSEETVMKYLKENSATHNLSKVHEDWLRDKKLIL